MPQWEVVNLIYEGAAEYSLVVPLTNTTLAVVYERGQEVNMTVAIVDVSAF